MTFHALSAAVVASQAADEKSTLPVQGGLLDKGPVWELGAKRVHPFFVTSMDLRKDFVQRGQPAS